MRGWIVALMVIFMGLSAEAQSGKNQKKGQEVSFEDLLVEGKYHFADEAVVTVEDDKILDSLLGIRKDFKDKIEQSASRN